MLDVICNPVTHVTFIDTPAHHSPNGNGVDDDVGTVSRTPDDHLSKHNYYYDGGSDEGGALHRTHNGH